MNDLVCTETNNSPVWGVVDFTRWYATPEWLGGGKAYIQRFKDGWVQHNKTTIKAAAAQRSMPAELLAGVCWIEVGGDPNFIDAVAFGVRAFDWSGDDWTDKNRTITNHPAKTSFGAVSIQLRTAAQTMKLDASKMTHAELSNLATCLQKDIFNIQIVAQHLRQLIDHDKLQPRPPTLTMDEIRVVGARYNRGVGLSLDAILKNTSYGDFIVKFWARFEGLLK